MGNGAGICHRGAQATGYRGPARRDAVPARSASRPTRPKPPSTRRRGRSPSRSRSRSRPGGPVAPSDAGPSAVPGARPRSKRTDPCKRGRRGPAGRTAPGAPPWDLAACAASRARVRASSTGVGAGQDSKRGPWASSSRMKHASVRSDVARCLRSPGLRYPRARGPCRRSARLCAMWWSQRTQGGDSSAHKAARGRRGLRRKPGLRGSASAWRSSTLPGSMASAGRRCLALRPLPRAVSCVRCLHRPNDYGSEGWGFESLRARFISPGQGCCRASPASGRAQCVPSWSAVAARVVSSSPTVSASSSAGNRWP